MKKYLGRSWLWTGAAVVAVAAALAAPAAALTPTVVYDNIPSPQPGNVPSIAFQATQTSEFGGQVQLAGTQRTDPTVTVLMSSWGCQSGAWFSGDCVTTPGATFNEPVTVNVYAVGPGGSVGALLATKTQTFAIPYRPSADPLCGDGRWRDGSGNCFNGYATPISFSLTGFTIPTNAIVSVTYNTSGYGYAPYGYANPCNSTAAGCGYDSLNVGTSAGPPSTGTFPAPNDAYLNSSTAANYCDGGTGGTGTFRLDAGCWTGFQPAIRISATPPLVGPPTSKDQCKDGGWQQYNNPAFKNQGDCVSYVATHGKNGGNW